MKSAPAEPIDDGDRPSDVVTLYVTHQRRAYPLQVFANTRFLVDAIFKRGEYGLLGVPRYRPTVIVDVGAHIGVFALWSTIHFPDARVVCFEPAATSFELLTANLGDAARCELHRVGLHAADGARTLYEGRDNTSQRSIHRSDRQTAAGARVELRRASTELARLGVDSIGILKLDTEGCELDILHDLEPLLERIDFIMVEYHSAADRRAIDALLADRFALYGSHVGDLRTGVLRFVNARLVAAAAL